jgi:hypothetical protein
MTAFVLLAGFIFRPGISSLLIALINVGYAFLVISALGNLCSLYLPFKLSSDSMRGAGNKPMALLTAFLFLFLLPLILLPPMVCALLDPALAFVDKGLWFPVGLVLSLVFLGLAILGYRWLLDISGGMLAKREGQILEAVTKGND